MAAVEQQVTSADMTSRENRFGIKSKRPGGADERLAATGWFTRLVRRPETGAAGGLLATIVIFALLPGAANLYSLQGSMTFLTLSAEPASMTWMVASSVAAQAVQMKRLIFTRPTGTPTFLATS